MDDLRVLVAFAALVSIALFYVWRGVPSSGAPLCAVSTVALWLTFFGCINQLWLGGLLLYLLAAVAAGWLVWQWGLQKKQRPALSLSFWFFVAAGLLMLGLLWFRQPMFTGWDEFSLWGIGGKLLKLYNELYTTAPVGWTWTQSQKPGLIVFGYFFQFLGKGYIEWQTYAACNILLLAAIGAVLAPFEKKQLPLALPVMLLCLMVPFVFQHYKAVVQLSPAWMDSLADIPLGFVFAGTLALWLGGRGSGKGLGDMLPVALGLGLITSIKDTGFALALVATGLIFADRLLEKADPPAPFKKRLLSALAHLGIGVAVVLGIFIGWDKYLAVDRTASLGGKQNIGMLQMPFVFFRDLMNPEKPEFFKDITGGMTRFFISARGNMLGSGLMVMGLVWALLALAFLLWDDKTHRRRCLVYGIFSTLGFLPYYLLITMSYLYILRPEQAFESYDRYVYPYYIGWLLAAVLLLSVAALRAPLKRGLAGKGALLLLGALVFAKVAMMVPVHFTLLGVHPDEFNERREFSAYVQWMRGHLDPEGKTFLVITEDEGNGWFMYHYEMLPWQLDYSYGGSKTGMMQENVIEADGSTVKRMVTPELWEQHLIETGCTYVMIDSANPEFVETYASLFADGMEGYRQGETNLYAVTLSAGRVVLVPMAITEVPQ